ncbi:CLIP domain-containing serine protease B15-like [Uranotaenia lowii]|uniref:CLIP domain-containing serine protease B15-like n=1 Tax=Uranotaenia lowii TaxID=190385 RepID=UPI0024788624|nr:CLIP domain-containing serine protease B15-like [Uranotaenia lowii]
MVNVINAIIYQSGQNYRRKNTCSNDPSMVCCPIIDSEIPCDSHIMIDKIVGGEFSTIRHYPWMALIFDNDSQIPWCGGSLINQKHVLSAAHCFPQEYSASEQRYVVRISEWDWTRKQNCTKDGTICRQILNIDQIFIHPFYNYTDNYSKNDIAVLRLSGHVDPFNYIKPICLPSQERFKTLKFDELSLEVAGWGGTEDYRYSRKLMKVKLPGKSLDQCRSLYKTQTSLDSSQLCVGGEQGKDSCVFDSGGPLMYQDGEHWVQLGLVSFGPAECGKKGYPSIYTNVFYHLNWIVDVVQENTVLLLIH